MLKFVYQGLLTGLPILTYNPFTKLNFISPFDVNPYSTYINYKLDINQFNYINSILELKNSSLVLDKVKIDTIENPSYYLSINIYNCSVPIIPTNKMVTRCEINTYVKNNNNEKGTVILDYISNSLSMDPINIFKQEENLNFINQNSLLTSNFESFNFDLDLELHHCCRDKKFKISDELIEYSDKIFYTNSIYDKLYYDSTLVNADVRIPKINKVNFRLGMLRLNKPESVFYFKDSLNFTGSLWHNLYTILDR